MPQYSFLKVKSLAQGLLIKQCTIHLSKEWLFYLPFSSSTSISIDILLIPFIVLGELRFVEP